MRPGIYKHYKGKTYLVIGVAHNSNNAAAGFQGVPGQQVDGQGMAPSADHLAAPQVVYIPLYPSNEDQPILRHGTTGLCVRSLAEFSEIVEYEDRTAPATPAVKMPIMRRGPRFEFVCALETFRP